MLRKKYYLSTVVHSLEFVAANTFVLRFNCPEIAKVAKPGQFVTISTLDEHSAQLLKRPFSIGGIREDLVELLIKIVGGQTENYSKLKVNDPIEVIGPLGNSFSSFGSRSILLVGGGIGIAPLICLEKELKKNNQVQIVYAVRTKEELADFQNEVVINHVDEEEGSFVTETVKKLLEIHHYDQVISCGPDIMMKSIHSLCEKKSLPLEVSLESHMACGFGVCLGCVVSTNQGNKKVCADGPIFNSKDIWETKG